MKAAIEVGSSDEGEPKWSMTGVSPGSRPGNQDQALYLPTRIPLFTMSTFSIVTSGWLPAASETSDCTSRPHQPICRLPNGVIFKASCHESSSLLSFRFGIWTRPTPSPPPSASKSKYKRFSHIFSSPAGLPISLTPVPHPSQILRWCLSKSCETVVGTIAKIWERFTSRIVD